MLKIILPIIFFILLVYGISYYWDKANEAKKKKISFLFGIILVVSLSSTIYLIID